MTYTAIHLVSVIIPVFRDGDRAIALVEALRRQQLPEGTSLEILVVDDCSDDGTADRIAASAASSSARLLRLTRNSGRGRAINCGVEASLGQALLFLDSDCLPASNDLVTRHLEALQGAPIASTGPIVGRGSGFWHRYQLDVSASRARRHAEGITYSATSTNFMVKRNAFLDIDGFNEAYINYGFEDRDLLLRLCMNGHITWTATATVRHMDTLTLERICGKMQKAGEHSSTQFATEYPVAYRKLGYAAADPRTRPSLRGAAWAASLAADPLARIGDHLLERAWIPYFARQAYARAVSGLGYLAGASRAPRFTSDAVRAGHR